MVELHICILHAGYYSFTTLSVKTLTLSDTVQQIITYHDKKKKLLNSSFMPECNLKSEFKIFQSCFLEQTPGVFDEQKQNCTSLKYYADKLFNFT